MEVYIRTYVFLTCVVYIPLLDGAALREKRQATKSTDNPFSTKKPNPFSTTPKYATTLFSNTGNPIPPTSPIQTHPTSPNYTPRTSPQPPASSSPVVPPASSSPVVPGTTTIRHTSPQPSPTFSTKPTPSTTKKPLAAVDVAELDLGIKPVYLVLICLGLVAAILTIMAVVLLACWLPKQGDEGDAEDQRKEKKKRKEEERKPKQTKQKKQRSKKKRPQPRPPRESKPKAAKENHYTEEVVVEEEYIENESLYAQPTSKTNSKAGSQRSKLDSQRSRKGGSRVKRQSRQPSRPNSSISIGSAPSLNNERDDTFQY